MIFVKIKKMNKSTPVSEIMTTNLIVVSPNTTLDKVKDIFKTYMFHHLPVVNNHCLVGIISKVDLYRVSHSIDLFHSKTNEELNNRLFKSLLAEEVMVTDTTVLAPDDTVAYAAELFNRNQFHALPVVVGEKLVGIVTTLDLIKMAYL
jgi:CBS domain-containing protein